MKKICSVLAVLMLAGLVCGQLSSSTEDSEIIIIPEKATNTLKISNQAIYDIMGADLKAEDAIADKIDDTPACSEQCYSVFFVDTSKGGVLRMEYYHDDLTFKEESDNIVDERIEVWDGKGWVAYDGQEGPLWVKVSATKRRNEDTAYLPIVSYKMVGVEYAEVRGISLALWMKGPTLNNSISGLVSAYPLDETSGNPIDIVGGFNGVKIGSPTQGVNGVFGKSVTFIDSDTAYYNFTNFAKPITAVSVSAWIKPNTIKTGSGADIINACDNGFTQGYGIRFDVGGGNAGLYCYIQGSEYSILSVVQNTLPNKWTLVTCVYNGTHVNSYINGSFVNSNAKSGNLSYASVKGMRFSRFAETNGFFYNGTVDEVLIFNRSLSDAEALNLYESGITQVNITNPVNGTSYIGSSVQVNLTSVIGAGDGILNISYKNTTSVTKNYYPSVFIMRAENDTLVGESNTAIYDYSNSVLGVLNSAGYVSDGDKKGIRFNAVTYTNASWPVNSVPYVVNRGMTVLMWVNVTGPNQIFTFKNTTVSALRCGIDCSIRSGSGVFNCFVDELSDTNKRRIVGTVDLRDTKQHFLAMSWTGTNTSMSLYVDGVLDVGGTSETAGTLTGVSCPDTKMFVGNSNAGSVPFNGTIYGVQVISRSMSAAEILNVNSSGMNYYKDYVTTRNNDTHYFFKNSEVLGSGSFNVTVSAFGGSGLVSSATTTNYFTIDTTTTTTTTIPPIITAFAINESNALAGSVLLASASIDDNTYPPDKWWFKYNGTLGNISTEVITPGDFYMLWRTLTLEGNYSVIGYVNDSVGNVNGSDVFWVNFYTTTTVTTTTTTTTTLLPPSITAYTRSPTEIYYDEHTSTVITITAGDGPLDKVYIKNAAGTLLNITDASAGANNLAWYPGGLYGTYILTPYVNDTSGNIGTTTGLALTVTAPMNVTNSGNTNDLISGRPLAAAAGVFTSLIGGLFWGIILGVIFLGMWLRTGNFIYPTLVLFVMVAGLGITLPSPLDSYTGIVFYAALGLVILRVASPSYTN